MLKEMKDQEKMQTNNLGKFFKHGLDRLKVNMLFLQLVRYADRPTDSESYNQKSAQKTSDIA